MEDSGEIAEETNINLSENLTARRDDEFEIGLNFEQSIKRAGGFGNLNNVLPYRPMANNGLYTWNLDLQSRRLHHIPALLSRTET